jgi:hypothetical protein
LHLVYPRQFVSGRAALLEQLAMVSEASRETARLAESIYHERHKDRLEKTHPNEFVAIEPLSGDFFLGHTLSEAIGAARKAHPNRLSHALRVGHKAAVHLGTCLV